MATVQARHERNDPNAGMQGAYYTVDIAVSYTHLTLPTICSV